MKFITNTWQNNKQFIVFILLMTVFRSAIADWYTVPTGSMQPTIKEGDRIVVNKMAYDLRIPFTQISLIAIGEPQRGDIAVFESQAADNRLIKRIIGVPGDVVSMKDEHLFINGQAIQYSQTQHKAQQLFAIEHLGAVKHHIRIDNNKSNQFSNFNSITVPDNSYLVLGDNRRDSADSRFYGFVPRHELKGKATKIAFSLDYDNYYLPRAERYFEDIYAL